VLDATGQALVYVYARETSEQADIGSGTVICFVSVRLVRIPLGVAPFVGCLILACDLFASSANCIRVSKLVGTSFFSPANNGTCPPVL
jgi:hypothetical protein